MPKSPVFNAPIMIVFSHFHFIVELFKLISIPLKGRGFLKKILCRKHNIFGYLRNCNTIY